MGRGSAVRRSWLIWRSGVGFPVFAGTPERGNGLAYIVGPTGGYLMGFLFAGIIAGALAERGWDRSTVRAAAVMTLGHILILGSGVAWLASLIGFERAVAGGLTPFALGTFLKITIGGLAMPLFWKIGERFRW